MERSMKIGRLVFAAAIASALGVGATQAAASPRAAAANGYCDTWNDWDCMAHCIEIGYDGGRCSGAGGDCTCYIRSR